MYKMNSVLGPETHERVPTVFICRAGAWSVVGVLDMKCIVILETGRLNIPSRTHAREERDETRDETCEDIFLPSVVRRMLWCLGPWLYVPEYHAPA